MKTSIRLRIDCSDRRTASLLHDVLIPDNKVPGDQLFRMRRSGSSVIVDVVSERAKSAFTSVNSVLVDSSLFQEVLLLTRRGARGGR